MGFITRALFLTIAVFVLLGFHTRPSAAQADPYVGQLMLTAATFCPRGTTEVNGQQIAIPQNTALYSLLGTTYGGDGRTTFNLPNLQGRTPIQTGQGPGLPTYTQGQAGGTTTTTLTAANLPVHNHLATATLNASSQAGTTATPTGNSLAMTTGGSIYRARVAPDQAMNAGSVSVTIGNSGGGQPFDSRTPYLTLRWCIALVGIFPPRN